MGKNRLPLNEILLDTLRQIDECSDPRKNEPIGISLRDYLERTLIELSDEPTTAALDTN